MSKTIIKAYTDKAGTSLSVEGGSNTTNAADLTDERLLRGAGGNGVQESGITVDDSNNISGVGTLDTSGNVTVTGDVEVITGDLIVDTNTLVTSGGNVGIGTASPSTHEAGTALNVESSTGGELILRRQDSTLNPGDFIGGFVVDTTDASNATPQITGWRASAFTALGEHNWSLYTKFNEYETVSSTPTIFASGTGSVGIGTSSPGRKLSIHENSTARADLTITNSTTGAAPGNGIELGLSAATTAAYLWNYENTLMGFGTNNTQRMTIAADGNVGIGTTAPLARLDVAGPIRSKQDVANGSSIAPALGRTGYLVTVTSNYGAGNNVRSGVYHVVTNNEGTAVAFQSTVSVINGQTAVFSVSGGNIVVNSLSPGNSRLSVVMS